MYILMASAFIISASLVHIYCKSDMPIALSQKDKSCLTFITEKQERNGKRCGEGVVGLRLEGGCEKRGGAKGEGMEEMEKDGDTKLI